MGISTHTSPVSSVPGGNAQANTMAVAAVAAGDARKRQLRLVQIWMGVAVAVSALLLAGCREEPTVMFEPNLVHAMKYQIKDALPMDQVSKDAFWVVNDLFGTPDDPKLPEIITEDEDLASIVKLDNLVKASGSVGTESRGLYRQHCALCHGITGNGRGTTAAVLVPYPRDYRMGIFKFKSTPRGAKPTREDVARLIRHGIDGTAMKAIPELTEDDIQALTDYVIYLSWRGELERALIDEAAMELDLEAGDRILPTELASQLRNDKTLAESLSKWSEEVDGEDLVAYETYLDVERRIKADGGYEKRMDDLAAKDSGDLSDAETSELEAFETYREMKENLAEDEALAKTLQDVSGKTTGKQLTDYQVYGESIGIVEDYVGEIGDSWLEAEERVLEIPEPPADMVVAQSSEDFLKIMQSDKAASLAASVERGQQLFVGKVASCSKCHGEKGLGNGQTTDYDDWTKDWTSRVGLKPEDRDSLIPLLARGALPPLNALPRNFAEGAFHGGSSSEDLYRRIVLGIDGSPMPASTFVEGEFEESDVWHLINFIRSIQVSGGNSSEAVPADSPAA